ncbi:MAG: hypothetical protein K2J91_04085 [Lachnospiraceae bacterium]|nr:hypothetical protein [Lachnospiraceae bacterium]
MRSSCGNKAVSIKNTAIFEGALIKESIDDENIFPDFPQLVSKVMISDKNRGGNWFADFKQENTKFVVFRNKILKYEIGNSQEKSLVLDECRKLGITDKEMNWQE